MTSTMEKEVVIINDELAFRQRVLPNWYGIEEIGFIYHGDWSDPEIEYQGKRLNPVIVENTMWDYFYEETGSDDLDKFALYMQENKDEVYYLISLLFEEE